MKTKAISISAMIATALALSGFGPAEHPVTEGSVVRSFVQSPGQAGPCEYNGSLLNGICNDVRSKDASRYERKIRAAACVVSTRVVNGREVEVYTSEDSVRIREMYNRHDSRLRCSGGGLSMSNGSIIKYAVSVRTFDFVSMAVNEWCFNLNQTDEDGTLLDWVTSEMARSASAYSALEPYYQELRTGGAMTRQEIEASGGNYPRASTARGCR